MIRKYLLTSLILLLSFFVVNLSDTFGGGRGRGGTYIGGSGSSHKGGHYYNPSTGNHYKTKGSSFYGDSFKPFKPFKHSTTISRPYKKYYSSPFIFHNSVQRDSKGRIERSQTAKEQFLRSHGYREVPHGYEVDHIVPLYAGGSDSPSNMQLLSVDAHRAKTKADYERYGR